ncbi:hypothetical protein PFISCL1PPCAC_11203, partial [Pristionchus fissidentatus]
IVLLIASIDILLSSACLPMIPSEELIPQKTTTTTTTKPSTNDCTKLEANTKSCEYYCFDPDYAQGSPNCVVKANPSKLIRTDTQQEITPVCQQGKWFSGGNEIPQSTKVACYSCAPLCALSDDGPGEPDVDFTMLQYSCKVGKLLFDFTYQGQTETITIQSLVCNANGYKWDLQGDDITPYYSSIEEIITGDIGHLLRCG